MWAVLKAMPWESINGEHVKMITPPEGEGQPQFFIPCFNKLTDAVKFAGKDTQLIIEISRMQP